MDLLPGYEHIPNLVPRAPERLVAPLDAPTLAGKVHVVETAEDGEHLLHQLRSMPIAAIALDSEFGYTRPGVPMREGHVRHDIRAQRPICFSVAALVTEPGGEVILRAVLDVRQPGVAAVLGEVLRLRVLFVCHHAKVELFSLWALGLDPDLHAICDTFITAAALHMGLHHKRAARTASADDEIQAETDLVREHAHLLSLRGQCDHYGLTYPFSDSKDELRNRFLGLANDPLDARLVDYAAADAEWTLRLYLAQQRDIVRVGLHAHLHTVEFPFVVANARIEWNGVLVHPERALELADGAHRAADHYAAVLREHGVDPPGSRPKFLGLMRRQGLRTLCRRGGRESTENDVLEAIEHHHPAIRAYRLHKRYQRLAGEEWLAGALTGSDGRIHPDHGQLGAATGRNTCRRPNLAGIGRLFRPVVVAPPGRALVELDYAQIEVGVAAAEHDDPDLIAAYNSGDVYAAMAQRFYAGDLSHVERTCGAGDFKRDRPELRDRMKTFVLAVLYNIQPPAIADRFDITEAKAAAERERFLDLYPLLKRRLTESAEHGAARGYASTVSGLSRRRPPDGRADSWTKNFLRNTPIQGSATVVFKKAIVDLDREFRGTTTRLVLPVHDSILIECDITDVDQVVASAADLMRSAMRAYYPKLQARVDFNRADTSCWNKDGHSDSLARFLADPEIRIEDCRGPLQP